MAKVVLKNLVKSFGQTPTVKGINLEIPDRSFVALVGPSGCGKSTTLRMIAGLENISWGEVLIDGQVVNEVPSRDRGVAMVFQSYALYPHMTVKQNLSFGLKVTGVRQAEINQRVNFAVEVLELQPYLERKPASLSGGQRQRVAMGRAIVRQPKVFLFDEPLSNLDAKLRNQMRLEIKKLHKKLNNTVIYVTHDQIEAMTMADIIVVMRDGIIEQVGSPLGVFQKPVNKFVAGFIGAPQMNFLAGHATGINHIQIDGISENMEIPPNKFNELKPEKKLIIGIRPEDIVPDGQSLSVNADVGFSAAVSVTEMLGNENLLYCNFGGREIVSRMQKPRKVEDNEMMKFLIDLEKIHLFDAETEQTLALE